MLKVFSWSESYEHGEIILETTTGEKVKMSKSILYALAKTATSWAFQELEENEMVNKKEKQPHIATWKEVNEKIKATH